MKNESLPPKLAFACPQRWENMRVDGPQRRFCDQCQLHVRDLSAMTKLQGERVVAGADGKLCVSFLVRPDGTMVTRGRWDGLKRGWGVVRRTTLMLLAMVLPFAFTSCGRDDRNTDAGRTGGSICVPSTDAKDAPSATLGRVRTSPKPAASRVPERMGGTPAAQ